MHVGIHSGACVSEGDLAGVARIPHQLANWERSSHWPRDILQGGLVLSIILEGSVPPFTRLGLPCGSTF